MLGFNGYRPGFKEAIEQVARNSSGEIYRHQDIQLAQTADYGLWEPSDEVLNLVPNIKHVKIKLIGQDTDLEDVMKIFKQERRIGLVLLGDEISRIRKPKLIVLTTNDVYFVIDPEDTERGMNFLKSALVDQDLTLYTTSGLFEADCLYGNYGISLKGSRARCCLGLHLHLMRVISCLSQQILGSREGFALYPERALSLARGSDIKLVSYEVLVRTWLNVDEINHFDLNPIQMVHLQTRPLDETATNMILRRCCLVLRLAEALEHYIGAELAAMNKNLISYFAFPRSKEVRDKINSDERRRVINPIYGVHLDNGVPDHLA